ncbi:MAG: 30S ribosome-binding factor RbfA [Francisellaceae bacterium]
MAASSRMERVADEVQKLIVTLLTTKIRDPRLQWVSITGVVMSRDLSHAKVYFSSLDEKMPIADIGKALNKSAGFFRSYLARELTLRIAPEVHFYHDESLDYGQKMETLIDKALSRDAEFIQENHASESQDGDDKDDDEKRHRLR